MDPGLVADLDRADATRERRGRASQDRVLGFPGQVGIVEVDQVVIADAVPARPPGQSVPDRLVQAAGDEAPLRQGEVAGLRQERHQVGIGPDDGGEPPPVLGLVRACLTGLHQSEPSMSSRGRTSRTRDDVARWPRECRVDRRNRSNGLSGAHAPVYSAHDIGVSNTLTEDRSGRAGRVFSQIQTAMCSAVGFSRPGTSLRQ